MKKRVAILISGGGSNMMALVNSMDANHPAKPVLVLSNTPDAAGLAKADAFGIPTTTINHHQFDSRADFEARLHAALLQANPDIICLAGFMRILTPEFIEKWAGKILNIHPSILPLFPGLHTHQRALDAGMAVHGCSVHLVTAKLDNGPILGQAVIPVLAGDTAKDLAVRLLPMEHQLYPAVLKNFAAGDPTKITIP